MFQLMTNLATYIRVLILMFGFLSCKKDSPASFEPFIPDPCGDTIYFQSEVKGPIIDLSCNVVDCHDAISAAAGIDYSTHAKIVPITHGMYKTMAHDSGFIPMPSADVRLHDTLLQKCYCWIQQGKLDN